MKKYNLICAGAFLSSCSTDIKEIKDNINDYNGKEVKVSGKVIETTDLMMWKYYQIEDKTGEIYIIPAGELPEEGQKLTVTGIVNEKMKVGKENLVVIKESED